MKLNKLIREKRIEKHMTLPVLAKKLGMRTPQQLCNLEQSNAPVPKKYLKRIVKHLDISQDQVIDIMVDEYKAKLMRYF